MCVSAHQCESYAHTYLRKQPAWLFSFCSYSTISYSLLLALTFVFNPQLLSSSGFFSIFFRCRLVLLLLLLVGNLLFLSYREGKLFLAGRSKEREIFWPSLSALSSVELDFLMSFQSTVLRSLFKCIFYRAMTMCPPSPLV